MFLAFKIIKKTRFRRLSELDIDSGKREMDLPAVLAEERTEQGRPMWKKTVC
jgi:amino acid transporter